MNQAHDSPRVHMGYSVCYMLMPSPLPTPICFLSAVLCPSVPQGSHLDMLHQSPLSHGIEW